MAKSKQQNSCRLKVLHLSSEKTWRGGEQQIAYLILELNKKGVQNHVACRKASSFEQFSKESNLPFTALSFKNQLDLSTVLGIVNYCKRNRIELIHVHSGKSHGLAVMASVAGFKGGIVLSRRVDVPPKKNGFSRWKYNHKSIKRILCVSNKIQSLVKEVLKDPPKAITVYDGIDLSRFEEIEKKGFLREKYNLPQEAVLVGNTSALADHKDYPTFIKTAKLLVEKHEGIYFFIVGEGKERGAIEQLLAEYSLGDRVFLTGFLKEIPRVLCDLDIFFMPSKTEGLGTSILDAFATKTPVVATRAGGIPEAVIHEHTGLLAEVADANVLAMQIERILHSAELRAQLTENAYKHLLKTFTKEKVAHQTLSVYQEILS